MVEMMIVVAIVALLTAMSIFSAKSYFEKARAKECRLNQQAIFNAVWNWRIDNQFLPGTSVTNFQLVPQYLRSTNQFKCPTCNLLYGPVFVAGTVPRCPGNVTNHVWKTTDKVGF